ncbi:CBS domain containing-hemolysin-like protein [Isoptericola sp. CG 20/1183]|uniref:CBS domain containing-hemolysin-like protein n=1 Tax=Isoptericola halotolerans TaxID=300560 RepID=A0ABX5EC20_9MICO|nr:CBS domain containing-hemolysin-like protein [Isoptericola sp. CG 20/1183]PRZ02991.1 CBS domain containing-hemolysin-like protein [Isoptericola halotolerans]
MATLLLGFVVIAVVIAANGYFVAQEFAYMSVDRSRLGAQADAGDATAARALAVTRRTSFMLSGAQLGITVTGLMVGYVAEPLVGESLAEILGVVGVPAGVSIAAGTVLALAASTVLQMIFGELFPKNLAIADPEPLARRLARSTQIYLAAFGWLITVFDHAANALLRLIRIEPVHDVDSSATARDLEHIVADSRQSGDLPEDLSMMLDRILDFPGRDVEHAMVPRSRVDSVDEDATVGEVRALMAAAHTRYPVTSAEDQPVGVVHLLDVLAAPDEDLPVSRIMRPAIVVPTLMSLPDALAELSAEHDELACVIDEYGGFAGILTLEDLGEEIVGELTDEHDVDADEVVEPDGPHAWRMDGDVHLDEVERAIGHDLPRGDYETLAGLLIASSGGLPEVGESIDVQLPVDPADLALEEPVRRLLHAEVLEVDRRVPAVVRVSLDAPGDGEGDGERDPDGDRDGREGAR